ncbi:FHA domain-containing protein [Undibacterium sp. Xuan67W]|uniref:FHA domain-containing protein n=1 Tax=Undibacterium sp. Xuan67W TaxID=3413057 RepID=UPI003BF0139E
MAKIVVTFNGLVQKEISILKPRLTIGRRPTNDIPIDHLTVSGQHAVIDTTSTGSFVLDLGSTNGTMVNGQPIKKHLLQNDDVIDIGKYKLRYELDPEQQTGTRGAQGIVNHTIASIKVLNGANSGKELRLTKSVTTIGSPAVQVVAITRQNELFFISQVDGATQSKLNDQFIDGRMHSLNAGDVIDLAGTKMQFTIG